MPLGRHAGAVLEDRMKAQVPLAVPRFAALPSFILLYVLMYAAFGVASPFWPRFIESRGITPEQIGVLLGLGTLVRLIAGPIAARLADRLQELRAVLASAVTLAACLAVGLVWNVGLWIFFLVYICHGAALAPTTSLADALALGASKLRSAHERRFEYGWVRGSASAAFILGTIIAGSLIDATELSAIVWMQAVLLLGTAFAALLLPAPRVEPQANGEQSSLEAARELLRIAIFRRLVLAAALVFGSHAMHDAFAVILWNAAGISSTAIGFLWSEAVAAEVVIFIVLGPRLVNWFGPGGAAAVAMLSAVIRWVVMATTTSFVVLAIVQPLHGMTFALLHLACMRLMADVVPQRLAATAQAIYALAPGLATALLTLLSGVLYARFGGNGFLLMVLLSLLALPLCPGLQKRC